jgi:hypothetical protein
LPFIWVGDDNGTCRGDAIPLIPLMPLPVPFRYDGDGDCPLVDDDEVVEPRGSVPLPKLVDGVNGDANPDGRRTAFYCIAQRNMSS